MKTPAGGAFINVNPEAPEVLPAWEYEDANAAADSSDASRRSERTDTPSSPGDGSGRASR